MGKSLEFTGRVTVITDKQVGECSKGAWEKQQFVVKDEAEQYPNEMLFDAFNKADEMAKFGIGAKVKVLFNPNAKEYNGRYYGSNSLWKVEVLEAVADAKSEELPY
jgi:hypothetical protein